ncbi:MAG: hypothetical protein K8T91_15135 [Planctomycetes bacterium]|nr:hypothetical protein [Planctomycetota bacterium]
MNRMIVAAALVAGLPSISIAQQARPSESALSGRIELDAHEHCFIARFFLKNNGKTDTEVLCGGMNGMSVVPRFKLDLMTITPPTYLLPPRRREDPKTIKLPAGKEVLYGTFTMGYPPPFRATHDREREESISAYITFSERRETVRTESQRLKIPAPKAHANNDDRSTD